ncbi:MAG: GyrI-like domain-containing protein [Candidatus Saganbacteria bacterium]|nr:GyrI-like domain-containing protein [Candidatus Saganbacteria bacterium]
MNVLKWILMMLIIVVMLVFLFMAYVGIIFPLKVDETRMGPYTIAYESFTGPYKDTVPVFAKVYEKINAEGLNPTRSLGIYYDNPAVTPADQLRSDCGVVIEKADLAKFNKVKGKFKVKNISQADCVVIEFPIRNMLSYMIGPMKAYPALEKYAKKKGYKWGRSYELYDEPQKKIFYVMEIAK